MYQVFEYAMSFCRLKKKKRCNFLDIAWISKYSKSPNNSQGIILLFFHLKKGRSKNFMTVRVSCTSIYGCSNIINKINLPFISHTNAFIDVDASVTSCAMLSTSFNLRNSLERANFSMTADFPPVSRLSTTSRSTTTLEVSSISVYTQ